MSDQHRVLDGRVAIVTGSGRGIGRSVAVEFARAGAAVVIATRTRSHAAETATEIVDVGGRSTVHEIDLLDPDAIEPLIDATIAEFGRLDIVVHNAAYSASASLTDLSSGTLRSAMAVNLEACFTLAKHVIPHLRESDNGRFLVTSSVTGPRVAMAHNTHYAASKAGVNGFIRSAALELARDGITVNGVEPGFIRTSAMESYSSSDELDAVASFIPAGRLGTPDDIAHAMVFLASPHAAYITGQTIVVDGGSTLPESPIYLPWTTALD